MKSEIYATVSQQRFLPILKSCVLWLAVGYAASQPTAWAQSPFETGESGDSASDGALDEKQELSPLQKLIAEEQDPLVLAIVKASPNTPTQWIHDIRALVNLKRFEIAREYLKEFLNALPDESTLASMQSEFGSALFIRFSNLAELQPEGATLSEAVMKAAGDQLKDMARLKSLVADLTVTDRSKQRSALVELTKSGSLAAVPMIEVLGDPARAADHATIRQALVALGDDAIKPLITTLASRNAELRVQALQVLGELEAMQAVPLVLRTALADSQDAAAKTAARDLLQELLDGVPSEEEAKRYLEKRLQNFLAGSTPGPVDQDDKVTSWVWDPAQQSPRQQTMPSADASFLSAAVVAEEIYRLDPSDAAAEAMYLATGLEMAKRINGYGRPLTAELGILYDESTAADQETLKSVLELASDHDMQGAAIAAVEQLGRSSSADILLTADGKPGLLALALVSPHTRVKAAAARTIMKLNPTSAYPGSSYLPEVLGYLSSGGGLRRVLIGHPRRDDALELAGYFRVLGFEVDSSQRGRDVMLRAIANPDYSFIILHDAIDHPQYRELVPMLRQDQRTGKLPVGLLAREENAESASWFARTDALTLDLAPPQTQADVAVDARRLLSLSGRSVLTQDEKLSNARFALTALSELASDPEQYSFYNLLALDELLEKPLAVPQLSVLAADVLGHLGTPRAQRALIDVANSHARPLAHRRAAVDALRTAVSLRGILLKRNELLRQYDIYNASEFMDQDTQSVLAGILDVLEAPSKKSAEATKKDD